MWLPEIYKIKLTMRQSNLLKVLNAIEIDGYASYNLETAIMNPDWGYMISFQNHREHHDYCNIDLLSNYAKRKAHFLYKPDYFPHMFTDEAMRAMDASFDNPVMEKLLTYLKIDVRDPQKSLKRRLVNAETEFMGVAGDVHKGTVEGINKITREKLGFDLFETDAIKVMAKYADVVGDNAHTAAIMQRLKDDGVLRFMQKRGMVDPEFTDALKQAYDDSVDVLDKSVTKLKGRLDELAGVVKNVFDPNERKGVLGRLVRDERINAKQLYDEARRLVEDPEVLQARLTVTADDLNKAIAEHEIAMVNYQSMFAESNVAAEVLERESSRLVEELKGAAKIADDAVTTDQIASGNTYDAATLSGGTTITQGTPLYETYSTVSFGSPISLTFTATDGNTRRIACSSSTAATINAATVPRAGYALQLSFTTDATGGNVITFGTNFKTTGTYTLTGASKYFQITFISDGTNLLEVSRTAAVG